eukprot:6032090-Prymnesium_polylepis.1
MERGCPALHRSDTISSVDDGCAEANFQMSNNAGPICGGGADILVVPERQDELPDSLRCCHEKVGLQMRTDFTRDRRSS